MGQIYHNGHFYSGGGENSSLIAKIDSITSQLEELVQARINIEAQLEELSKKETQLLTEITSLKSQDSALTIKLSQVESTANAALPVSKVTNSQIITNPGYAVDATENNPNRPGSLAYQINALTLNPGSFIFKYNGGGTPALGFPEYPSAWLHHGFCVTRIGDTEEAKQYSPLPYASHAVWFNVLTFGISNRVTQLAFYGFTNQGDDIENGVWIRTQHDTGVTAWKKIA